ncbi:MAG: hypothetical protein Q7R88_00700, partial [bacterium]|nr:hypothetical protein [bacterium]
MNIPELRLKIKQSAGVIQSREVYTVLLILFVGFSSFGLGRLSKLQEARVPISIHSASALSATPPFQGGVGGGSSSVKGEKLTVNNALEAPVALEQGGQLVASKNG